MACVQGGEKPSSCHLSFITSTGVSDWGMNDTTSFDKKVMVVVTVSFAIE